MFIFKQITVVGKIRIKLYNCIYIESKGFSQIEKEDLFHILVT